MGQRLDHVLGGRGQFVSLDVPAGRSGHELHRWPELWGPHVERFLDLIGAESLADAWTTSDAVSPTDWSRSGSSQTRIE